MENFFSSGCAAMIFVGVNVIVLIHVLPEKAKGSPVYLRENSIKQLDPIVGSTGLKPHTIFLCLHFDHAPARNARTIAQIIAECDLPRVGHPAYSRIPLPVIFPFWLRLRENDRFFVPGRWKRPNRKAG
jgi:hypothetical protein